MTENLPAESDKDTEVGPALSDDVRKALLQEQSEQLTYVEIPRVAVMAAGAGLYEFQDTQRTEREFDAVVLSSHGRNTMWDRAYGDDVPEGTPTGPACSSGDGHIGRPRPGFTHRGIGGAESDGTESISCEGCPYNEWGSATLLGKQGRGKACTNQRSVYLVIEGAELPYELILSPTSLRAFDQYSATLINQGFPLPAVVTHLSQKIVEKGTMKWAQAVFTMGDQLDDEQFGVVREKMQKYASATAPRAIVPEAEWENEDGEGSSDDEETPF
jgi:hypothetical protein